MVDKFGEVTVLSVKHRVSVDLRLSQKPQKRGKKRKKRKYLSSTFGLP
jgi:hypothetical protein